MAAITCFFLFALLYSGQCQPIGQTTYCESQSLPTMIPSASTTVCESTPNLLSPNLLNLGLSPFLTSLGYPLPPLPYNPIIPNVGSTTVCESQPNLPLYGSWPIGPIGYPGIGYPGTGYPGLPQSSTTVCETSPNIYDPRPGVGSTTVCESSPNMVMDPLSLGLLPRALNYPGTGATTVCESAPNLGLPGIYGMQLGLPYRSKFPLQLPYPGLLY